jgi:hypothetical protein
MPIKIKNHENFEPNMPKVPITQSGALWAPPPKNHPKTGNNNQTLIAYLGAFGFFTSFALSAGTAACLGKLLAPSRIIGS